MKIIFLILFMLVLTPAITESYAEEIEIKFGETIHYDNLKLYFYDIEDSRCPSDVACIWEGKVSAMIRISNDTHDIGGPQDIGFMQKSFVPYFIMLKDVKPYPISSEKPDYVTILEITNSQLRPDEFTDEQICGEGHALIDGICMPKSIWDSSDFRGLQTGETMSNPEVAIILESLGAILIVLFIIIYVIKKRMKKNEN